MIKDRIVQNIQKFKLIRESQHGFVKSKSCLTNLLEFLTDVSVHVDKGIPVGVIYLDFQKAFDKVPHNRLIAKLSAFGIGGTLVRWIQSWLSERE